MFNYLKEKIQFKEYFKKHKIKCILQTSIFPLTCVIMHIITESITIALIGGTFFSYILFKISSQEIKDEMITNQFYDHFNSLLPNEKCSYYKILQKVALFYLIKIHKEEKFIPTKGEMMHYQYPNYKLGFKLEQNKKIEKLVLNLQKTIESGELISDSLLNQVCYYVKLLTEDHLLEDLENSYSKSTMLDMLSVIQKCDQTEYHFKHMNELITDSVKMSQARNEINMKDLFKKLEDKKHLSMSL